MWFEVVKQLTAGAAVWTLLWIRTPLYFTPEQVSRQWQPSLALLPSPLPSPQVSLKIKSRPEVKGVNSAATQAGEIKNEAQIQEMETPYGKIRYSQVLHDVWAISYDSTCVGCDGVTATGMKQGYGVVAVDPKVIPLFSKVYVPGYGIGIAGDVGGRIKGKMIDLGYDKLEGQWSARFVEVYLIGE